MVDHVRQAAHFDIMNRYKYPKNMIRKIAPIRTGQAVLRSARLSSSPLFTFIASLKTAFCSISSDF